MARLPELVLVGALAWCFLVGELAAQLHLSREMGALIAGVSLSTFPYALDVTAKVTSLRDFFVTLFFVGLGMTIPLPSGPLVGWALAFAAFVLVSRAVLTFTPLYLMKHGLRASLLPSINLCQISEFSLVVMAMGVESMHIGDDSKGIVSFAFVLLAALSTFAMTKSDGLVRASIPVLKRLGLRDLDDSSPTPAADAHAHGARILIIGFFRTASSLLEELRRTRQDLLGDIAVVDFNPVVHQKLHAIGVKAIYGDISQPDTLRHAGVEKAEILVCTIPDTLLKGTTNLKLVRQLREMNSDARIVTVAEVLSEIPALYEAGACYVSVARLDEASDLCEVLQAVDCGLVDEKCEQLHRRLDGRDEVLP